MSTTDGGDIFSETVGEVDDKPSAPDVKYDLTEKELDLFRRKRLLKLEEEELEQKMRIQKLRRQAEKEETLERHSLRSSEKRKEEYKRRNLKKPQTKQTVVYRDRDDEDGLITTVIKTPFNIAKSITKGLF